MKKILWVGFLILSVVNGYADPTNWPTASLTTLSTAGVDASDPQIVIDSTGQATAAWVEGGTVKTNTRSSGGSWGLTATPLSVSPGSSSPRLVVDKSGTVTNGTVTAIWIEGATSAVRGASMTPGGSWSIDPLPFSGGGASLPWLAIDSSGNAVSVWARNVSGTINIESSTKLVGGSWSVVDVLGTGAAINNFPNPKVALNNDVVIAVWHTDANAILSSNKTISGGTWSISQKTISNGVRLATNPNIAVDTTGIGRAIWFEYDLKGTLYSNVMMENATFNGGWSAQSDVTEAGISNPNELMNQILMDNVGIPMVLWDFTHDGSNFKTDSKVKNLPDPSGSWYPEHSLSDTSPYSFLCNADITAGSDVYAVTMDYDYINQIILINVMQTQLNVPFPGSWQNRQTISTAAINDNPKIATALAKDGVTLNSNAVWVFFDGSNTQIQSIQGAGSIPLQPSGMTVTPGSITFGPFTEFFNTVSWTTSPDIDLKGYYLLRNNIFIGYIPAPGTSFIDHNRPPTESGFYGLSAVMTDGSQSSLITKPYP